MFSETRPSVFSRAFAPTAPSRAFGLSDYLHFVFAPSSHEAFKGDAKRVHKLVKSSASLDINAIDVNGSGYSALHLAAVGGHVDASTLLP